MELQKLGLKPAWEDPYSKQVQIKTSSGEVVTGDVYETQMQQYYEMISPTPKWAQLSSAVLNNKTSDEGMFIISCS